VMCASQWRGRELLACTAVGDYLCLARQSDWAAIGGGFNQNPQSRHLIMYGAKDWSTAVRKL
jgi:hypothetical protein